MKISDDFMSVIIDNKDLEPTIAILTAHRNAQDLGIIIDQLHVCGNCVGVWDGEQMTVLSFVNPYVEIYDGGRMLDIDHDYYIGSKQPFNSVDVHAYPLVKEVI